MQDCPSTSCPPASPSPRSNRAPAGPERGFVRGPIDARGEKGRTGGALCRIHAGRRRRRARLPRFVLPVLLLGGVRRVDQRPLLPAARGKRHPGQGERKTQHPPASGTSRTPAGGRRRGQRGLKHPRSIDGRRSVAIHRRRTRTVPDPVNAGRAMLDLRHRAGAAATSRSAPCGRQTRALDPGRPIPSCGTRPVSVPNPARSDPRTRRKRLEPDPRRRG